MTTEPTAEAFMELMQQHQSDDELRKIQRYFKSGPGDYGEGDQFMGVRMGQVFTLSKQYAAMPLAELEKLLDSPIHEARAAAVKMMSEQASARKTTEERRKDLFDLYLRRHDRINNWDLVDLGCMNVVGRYLIDKPRDVLYTLARSRSIWERRTAIVSCLYFTRKGDLDDAFALAEILVNDPEPLMHKAVGWALRTCDIDRPRLEAFLDRHAATMPRTMLRYTLEHFYPERRAHYMGMKKSSSVRGL